MTTDFDKKGFLGDEIQERKASAVKSYQELFDLFYELNKYSQEKKFAIESHSENGQQVLSVCLFTRILNGVQAACILLSHGLANDARVVLRSCLEALFVLTKIAQDSSFVGTYVGADEIKRLKLMEAARKYDKVPFLSVREYATDEVMRSLRTKIREKGFKPLNIKNIAESVGMGLHYESAYRLLSDDIHTAVRSLEGYVGVNTDSELERIDWGPQFDDIPVNLSMAIDVLLRSWQVVDNLFGLSMQSELITYMQRLESIQNQYSK